MELISLIIIGVIASLFKTTPTNKKRGGGLSSIEKYETFKSIRKK